MAKKKRVARPVAPPARPIPVESQSRPSWRHRLLLDEKHAALWAAVAVLLTVVGLLASYIIPWSIQTHVEASTISKITYAVSITPNPPPSRDPNANDYWGNTILVWNSGPATAKLLVLHLHVPSPDEFLHSPPKLISAPAAAEVQINERTPKGIYEVVLRNFSPGDFCGVRLFYRAEGDFAKKVRHDWDNGGMLSPKFAKHFIKQFWFTGENLEVQNIGMLDVPLTFPMK